MVLQGAAWAFTSYLKFFTCPGKVYCFLQVYSSCCQLRQLVILPQNQCNGESGLRNPAVYPGTCGQSFSRCADHACSCFCSTGMAGFAKQVWLDLWGYITADSKRESLHALGGYLYWMSYIPENFPSLWKAVYRFITMAFCWQREWSQWSLLISFSSQRLLVSTSGKRKQQWVKYIL